MRTDKMPSSKQMDRLFGKPAKVGRVVKVFGIRQSLNALTPEKGRLVHIGGYFPK